MKSKLDGKPEEGASLASKNPKMKGRGRTFSKSRGKRPVSPRPGEESRSDFTSGHNDIKWLLYNPALSDIASRIAFGRALGSDTTIFANHARSGGTSTRDQNENRLPGILMVRSLLTAGYSPNINSDFNVICRNIWTKLRSAGTGSVVNDPCDLGAVLIGEGQIIAFYGFLRMIIDVLYHFNPQNKYAARAIIEALSLDYDDLVSHLAELVYFTNYVGSKINNFVIPNVPYFDQCYEAFRHIHVDQDLYKGQYILMAPKAFGYISFYRDATNGTQITYIDPYNLDDDTTEWGNDVGTFVCLKRLADKMFTPLLSEEYVMTLNAAILKAYKDDLWVINDFDTSISKLEVGIDAEFILQLHNMEFYAGMSNNGNDRCSFNYKSVTPSGGDGSIPYLVSLGTTIRAVDTVGLGSGSVMETVRKHYFDMFSNEPTSYEVILASRWKLNWKADNAVSAANIISSTDVIVPIDLAVYHFAESSSGIALREETLSNQCVVAHGSVSATTPDKAVTAMMMNTFTGSPLFFGYYAETSSVDVDTYVFGDTHNLVAVDSALIADIHRANVFSLFKVPFRE